MAVIQASTQIKGSAGVQVQTVRRVAVSAALSGQAASGVGRKRGK